MEDLVNLVALLRNRIQEHRSAFRANEALTRYALIDPLLRALGWNTEDPAQVVPEYSIPSKLANSADYALFTEESRARGVPEVVVEAKKLGLALTDAAEQAVNYCAVDGFEYFVVTDGDDWQLFGTRRRGNLDAKRIVQFHVCSDPTADVCRKALTLWRQGFEDAVVNVAPAHPVGDVTPNASTSGAVPTTPPAPKKVLQSPASAIPDQDPWRSLATFVPQSGTKPVELRLPTGAVVGISSWKDLMIEVTKSLIASGVLSATSEPLRVGRRYVLNTQPKHPDGSDFADPRVVGELHLETKYSAVDAVRHTRSIATHAGADAGEFAIRMPDVARSTTAPRSHPTTNHLDC